MTPDQKKSQLSLESTMPAPDSDFADNWFVSPVKPSGPFDSFDIEQGFEKGLFNSSDWIWSPSLGCWVMAADILAAMGPSANSKPGGITKGAKGLAEGPFVVRIWRIVAGAVCLTILSGGAALLNTPVAVKLSAALLCVIAAIWTMTEVYGARFRPNGCRIPLRPIAFFPVFSFLTMKSPMYQFVSVTKMMPAFGCERVLVETESMPVTILFNQRDERLAFTERVKRANPATNFYREG